VTQNYANHASLPKPFFLFLTPVFLVNVVVEGVRLTREPSLATGWNLVVAIALLFAIWFARATAMKVQDRIIVPESLARIRSLVGVDLQTRVDALTKGQIVALRFASDAEVEPLVRRIVAGELTKATAVKKAISAWRADLLPRV
jgi:thiol:disulfide interchange protein